MPLPLIIGGIAAVAGLTGIGSLTYGGVKMKESKDTMEEAENIQKAALERFEKENTECLELMDKLGKKELDILATFDDFSDLIEKIQGRPKFKTYSKNGVELPVYEAEELHRISAGAGLLLGGVGGAAAGTAGGFAAAGATSAAVMALGTASTGTAISTLSGVAATNATLAALGGGSLAAGGGGMALGSMVLGGATLGVGILIGGIIFGITGSKLSSKADEALTQAKRTEEEVEKVCVYLSDLKSTATKYMDVLEKVDVSYRKKLSVLDNIVNFYGKTEWETFTEKEKQLTKNLALLVGLLYKMCQVNLVIKSEGEEEVNQVNSEKVNEMCDEAENVMNDVDGR